jgi:hypothetical protein
MNKRRILGLTVAVAGVVAVTYAGIGVASAAGARPAFQLPFPCGQTWNGDSDNSSAHRAWEIDFNRGSTADADYGDTILAAAAGTVLTSAHQGSANGYGNLVVLDHGGGWRTYYAHLSKRSVNQGARVAQGQKIGELGNSSKPGNNISPHLHYEVRTTDGSYPSNIQKAYFNGTQFGYPNANVRSNNSCSGGTSNPYTATEICGDGYSVIDQAALGTAGRVYLLYNTGNGKNCVATIKQTGIGSATGTTTAYLEVKDRARITDSGAYGYYAGPVRAAAENTCVKWGGAVGSNTYDSPSEHCG